MPTTTIGFPSSYIHIGKKPFILSSRNDNIDIVCVKRNLKRQDKEYVGSDYICDASFPRVRLKPP